MEECGLDVGVLSRLLGVAALPNRQVCDALRHFLILHGEGGAPKGRGKVPEVVARLRVLVPRGRVQLGRWVGWRGELEEVASCNFWKAGMPPGAHFGISFRDFPMARTMPACQVFRSTPWLSGRVPGSRC